MKRFGTLRQQYRPLCSANTLSCRNVSVNATPIRTPKKCQSTIYNSPLSTNLPPSRSLRSSTPASMGLLTTLDTSTDVSSMIRGRHHRAFIALGSNLGDRVAWIEAACNAMESTSDIKIKRTSSLWETTAMYVTEQDKFVNGACEIETSLGPIELLDRLQSIENGLGRVKVIDKGPRNIDLDILLYDQDIISTPRLQVPHQLMLEREFVLRPLCEMISHETLPGASVKETLFQHLQKLPMESEPLSTLVPLAKDFSPITPLKSHRTTQIMSIVNLTPDSFSDGGHHVHHDIEYLKTTARNLISAGATLLDLGGQSTRPQSVLVSPEEELSRIMPAIHAIRSLPEAAGVVISIDTFYASVAEKAIKAGAHMINDVSGGTLDPDMLSTAARLGCTICLMHMRGTPQTMTKLTSYPDGVVETVGRELVERVKEAEEAGIRRWRIILDPGLGFAKNQEQNIELLRRLEELKDFPGLRGFPWLVGASRKGFVGTITGVKNPKDRAWGTAGAVSAAVKGGADIIRVHDVEAMGQVAKMADAVWRY